MALSSTLAGNFLVPLNCICSVQWEMLVFPVVSSFEPTRYQTHEEMIGAVCTSLSITFKPFFNTTCVILFVIDLRKKLTIIAWADRGRWAAGLGLQLKEQAYSRTAQRHFAGRQMEHVIEFD